MNRVMTFRQAVIDGIADQFPVLSVEPHRGRFDAKSLDKMSISTPALYVACMGWNKTKHRIDNEVLGDVRFIAYLATDPEGACELDETALNLADLLTGFIDGNRFGHECFPPDVPPHTANLFSGELAKKQIDLWALSWTQRLTFGNSVADKIGGDGDGSTLQETIDSENGGG